MYSITSYQQVFDEQMSQVASCKARKGLSKHNLFHSGFLLDKGIRLGARTCRLNSGCLGGGVCLMVRSLKKVLPSGEHKACLSILIVDRWRLCFASETRFITFSSKAQLLSPSICIARGGNGAACPPRLASPESGCPFVCRLPFI